MGGREKRLEKAMPITKRTEELKNLNEENSERETNSGTSNEPSEAESESEDEGAPQRPTKRARKSEISAAEVRAARETSDMFKSNVFKLQVGEVLKEISVDQKYASLARKLLFSLREAISKTSEVGPVSLKEAQRLLTTRIPWSRKPNESVKYKFAYVPPVLDEINVIGSWSIHTTVRKPTAPVGIDLFVPMASSIFDSKDFLDYRYHDKRAFFLAVLASQLSATDLDVDLRFEKFNGHALKPVLKAVPTGSLAKLGRKVVIFIHPGPSSSTLFPISRLERQRIADRTKETATPVYNWSVLSDMCIRPLLRYLHAAATTAPSFADAVKIGTLWLQQRRWGSDPTLGGFGPFEFSVLLAALLNGGLDGGKKRLLGGFSSYQLFKGVLLYISESEKIALQASMNDTSQPTLPASEAGLVFADMGLDVLVNMPRWAPSMLRHDATLAVDMLGDGTRDRFDALFLRDASTPRLRFDFVFDVIFPDARKPAETMNAITHVLSRAWDRRFISMRISSETPAGHDGSWPLASDPPNESQQTFQVGAILNPDNAEKRVTFTSAEFANVDDFKSFWGTKASLRRFQDGTIKEAVVWAPGIRPIVQEAASYSLSRHLHADVESKHVLERMLPAGSGTGFSSMSNEFRALAQILQELRSLPLRILSVYGTSASLRSSSIEEPQPFNAQQAAEGIIEVESSGRWPNELEAGEKVKTAFLIKLAETFRQLHPQYYVVLGLEPSPQDAAVEGAFVTIQTPAGFYFKLRIVTPSTRGELGDLADHTRLMSTMVQRYTALSTTVRLTKLWLERQMVMTHITEPAAELLALHAFVNSSPWAPPVSATTAFWRVLDTLGRWNWREEGLVLDVDRRLDRDHEPLVNGCDMDFTLFQSMSAAFELQRKQDPALTQAPWVIATKLDIRGTKWTTWQPRSRIAAIIHARVTALARASRPGKHVFKPSLEDFDVVWKVRTPENAKHKNIAVSDPQSAIIGAHNIGLDLVNALVKLYKDALILFYAGSVSPHAKEYLLAGVWNRSLEPLAKFKTNVAYPLRMTSENQFVLDKDSTLAEIDRLGGGILEIIKR